MLSASPGAPTGQQEAGSLGLRSSLLRAWTPTHRAPSQAARKPRSPGQEWRQPAGGAEGGSGSQAAVSRVRRMAAPQTCLGAQAACPGPPGWATRVVLPACGATLPGAVPARTMTRRPPALPWAASFLLALPRACCRGPAPDPRAVVPPLPPRPLGPLLRGASWEATTKVPWGEPGCDSWTSEHFRRGLSCRPRPSSGTGTGRLRTKPTL